MKATMAQNNESKLSTEPYKGVRDFYPQDMAIQNYMFDVMRKTVESFGYAEYSASILEPAELYRAKSGDEIVNEQTYTFTDRGGREVTLRPEMTPTVARMIAAKKRELSFPVRWYSIPNLFRYERPQRGRLREHWQLNVDLFGAEGIEADAEIITIAYQILKNFGLEDGKYVIKINHKNSYAAFLQSELNVTNEQLRPVTRVLDKLDKITDAEAGKELDKKTELKPEHWEKLIRLHRDKAYAYERIAEYKDIIEDIGTVMQLKKRLSTLGIDNTDFIPTMTRGFDYYTGMIFEVFDTSPQNNRSLFGGGRYDGLTAIFGEQDMPAVGFGMGDVTIRDVLETYNLIPESVRRSKTDLYIGALGEAYVEEAQRLARRLRKMGLNVATDLSGTKKMDDHNKKAAKDAIPFIVCVGEEEARDKMYRVKEVSSSEIHSVQEGGIAGIIQRQKEKNS